MAALDGITVLDFTRVLSGPHATRMLRDLGARVIKVEPPAGDLTRFAMPRVNGISTYFAQQNVGKDNVSIDLTDRRGAELAAALAGRCDVLVENFRPGVMERFGLGPETLRADNPRLVYASISGYGADGPLRDKRAYNVVIAAEAGLTKFQGDARGGSYESDPFDHADLYTALEAAAAILAALVRRERTGMGDWIDVSMAHTLLYVNDHLHDQLFDGDVAPGAVRSFGTSDFLVLTVASGEHMAVSGHPAERGSFEYFVGALGLDDLADHPRFATVADRMANLGELTARFAEAAARIADRATFEQRFADHRLATGVVQDARTLAESEWGAARGVVRTVPDRGGGEVRLPSAPWRFASEVAPGGPADVAAERRDMDADRVGYRGEDNRAVLGELLGLDDAGIEALEAAGVLSSRPPRTRPRPPA